MPQLSTPGLPTFMMPRTTPESQATFAQMEALKSRTKSLSSRIRGAMLARRFSDQTAGPGTQAKRDLLLSSAPVTSASSLAAMYAAADAARNRAAGGGY